MEPYSGFENDFSRHARVVKFGLGMQAVTIGFVIYLFISVLSSENDEEGFGAEVVLILFGILAGFVLLISHLAFTFSLMKFGTYRKSFKTLAVLGCVACILPLTGFFTFMINMMADVTLKIVVALVIALIIFSVRPVYYLLMRSEIAVRVNEKQAAHWKNLILIDIVFILCGVTAFALLIKSGHFHSDPGYDSLVMLTEVLGIVTGIAFAARLIYEFICTAHTERKLFETHSHTRKEDFPIYVQN